MTYKTLALQSMVSLGFFSVSFLEELNVVLQTGALLISIAVGLLTFFKIGRDLFFGMKEKKDVR